MFRLVDVVTTAHDLKRRIRVHPVGDSTAAAERVARQMRARGIKMSGDDFLEAALRAPRAGAGSRQPRPRHHRRSGIGSVPAGHGGMVRCHGRSDGIRRSERDKVP